MAITEDLQSTKIFEVKREVWDTTRMLHLVGRYHDWQETTPHLMQNEIGMDFYLGLFRGDIEEICFKTLGPNMITTFRIRVREDSIYVR